jgi:hypothetical protein
MIKKTVNRTVRMKLDTLKMGSDSSRSAREVDRHSKMATEGHRSAEWKKPELMSATEMDRELADIKREMEELEMKMRQNKKPRWVHEWPMKEPKIKWPVRELMARRQRRLLRKWLRYAENLRPIEEEEMVQVCEPEIGEIFGVENEMRSADDLKDCHEGREEEILVCQEGNELRSAEDLTDCHEDSQETLHCQLGNEMRSLRDLEDCQEGSGSNEDCQEGRDEQLRPSEGLMVKSSIQQGVLMKMGSIDFMVCQEAAEDIPYCQVGRDEQMNLDQPEELTEQMRLSDSLINSEMERDQQMQLTEEEDQNDILMIGGIGVFLPCAQEEAEMGVADGATAEQSQLTMTVEEEELEQTLGAAQADEENEHSVEWLNDFSQ